MKYLVVAVMMGVCLSALTGEAAAQEQDETVTALQDVRRGEFVTVKGEVTRMRENDEFIVEDGSGRAEVYVRGGLGRPTFRRGDTVTVRGWVDDDLISIPREIYATEIELSDGTIIEIRDNNWD